MNRTMLIVAGLFSVPSLLLVDSAVKGTALLVLAAIVAIILRRDSAATRHLVWLLAIVAMLAVPVLSAMLPEWRVLPRWASIPPATAVVATSRPSIARPAVGAAQVAQNSEPDEIESPSASAFQSPAALPNSRPALKTPEATGASAVGSWNWLNALPLVWAIGFCVLILRLITARWMLWTTERQGTVISPSRQPAKETHDTIVSALEAVCMQLGIFRPVNLLIHPDKTIPVVWGILRCHLLLPAAARDWSDEQLRSVLLHELAHIKRRDTTAKLLTQIACALHWFNPLVWFAAWRLDVERERACDDLVLSHGVQPSAYAGHLLEIVTGLSPGRRAQSCGLAMASQSSLEGRLAAVLSGGRNRRGVTRLLATAAVILSAAIAVPLAMLCAAASDQPETAAVNAEPAAPKDSVAPKDVASRPLFENWKTSARGDGKIPGGRIGEMAASLKTYMDLNAGTEAAAKCERVLKKCDATHDWTPAEAAALLDEIEIAAPSRAEWVMRDLAERQIHPGKPLPEKLKNAPWGSPPRQLDASSVALRGLRMAWLLEPREETQPLDSVLKSRVLFHNTSRDTLCFATEDWIQTGTHKAHDANGKDIPVWAVERMGLRTRMIFRLAPGEYAEVVGHGIGVGSHETSTEKSIYNVGAWIEAKEGDAVIFSPGSVPVSFKTWKNNEGLKDSVTVWREMIAARVMQESPMPASAADRELLLRRVMGDFPGVEPTAEEIAAFVADDAKDALARLIEKLQLRCAFMHFDGELTGGETKFRVTAAAPKKEEPQGGAQLKPATEQKLKWGEPANGLRMALAWPPSLGEPGMGDAPEFYLVVQNVSEAAVRLTANDAAPNPRRLIMRDSGSPLAAFRDEKTMPGDWLLRPQEVAFLRLFQSDEMLPDGRTHSAALEQPVRVYPSYNLTAEMTIEKAPEGNWTGKLATGQTRGSVDVIPPKHKDAQALYQSWTTASRTDGKIPGGLIALLGESVKLFTKSNPTWETTPQLEKMLLRLDPSHDWTGPDAVALLDEVAALQSTPISMALDRDAAGVIRTGSPLPAELVTAPWGETLANGLRHAWLLEPRTKEHRLGTPLKARILIHNAGKTPVVFRTRSWHQLGHTARDAQGAEIKVESTSWTTRGRLTTFRLAPGEFIEVNAPGIGVGPKGNSEDWLNTRVGSWVEAKAGDDMTVTTAPLPLSDWNDKPEALGEPRWWLDHIRARLARHEPFPADAEARLRLLHLVAIEVLGTSVSKEMNDAFVADATPTALESAATRLFHRPGLHAWAGSLTSAPTKFRVLPADPDAAKRPRTASNPGRYTLSDKASLHVSRRGDGERVVNEAYLSLSAPGERYEVKLPDGYDSWAAAWLRGGSVLWVSQKGLLRKVDFTNLAKVQETRFEADQAADAPIPPDIREALSAALAAPEAPKQVQEPLRPAAFAPASEAPKKEPPKAEKPKDNAAAKPPGEGEIVFITRETQRQFPKLDAGKGVTLEIQGQVFHGTDVQTIVRIRWPPNDGIVLGHDVHVAMDAFANREKWAIGWVRGMKTFWHVSNDLDGRTPGNTRLHRTTFENPQHIVTDYDANYPGEPIDGLGVPPELRAKFEQFFGIAQPKVVDKSGGLPDISGRTVSVAQPVKAGGNLPEKPGRPSNDRRWKVQFVNRDSGQPAPGVRVRLHVRNANGSQSFDVVRIVFGNEVLEPALGADQFATVEVVDDRFRGGGGSRVFGNIPQDWLAAEKHTDPDKPFIVKVWPTSSDPKPPDDALWKTKSPFDKIPVAITNWSDEQNGLRIGIRVLAEEGWRVGVKVKLELWVHNPGAKDVWFVANPGRSDVGLTVSAKDAEGHEHFAENGNVMIIAIPMHCVLPAGHVAKVKDFTLSFDTPDDGETAWFEPKFRGIEPGKYQLRCTWSDAHPLVSGDGEWTGRLTTRQQEFTLQSQATPK